MTERLGSLAVAQSGEASGWKVAALSADDRESKLLVAYHPETKEWLAGVLVLEGSFDDGKAKLKAAMADPSLDTLDAIEQALLDMAGIRPARDGEVVAGGDA